MSIGSQQTGLTALRSSNRAVVIQALRRAGEVSRAELSRSTGLSGTTISSLVSELSASGVITETARDDRGSGRTGRPGRLIRLAPTNDLVAGIDLAGSEIQLAIADLSGRICAQASTPADIDGAGMDALSRAADLLDQTIEDFDLDRTQLRFVVIGIAGIVDTMDSRVVVSDRMHGWQDFNPAEWFRERTSFRTQVENDADLAALGERARGAGRGVMDMVFVKVSAGIGAGLVLSGQLYRGRHGAAGEIGHVQAREDGEICSCGNRGCLETIASVNSALQSLRAVHPSARTARDLADLVESGDRAAMRVVADAGLAVGRAIADLCNTLAPEIIVLGGEMTLSPGPLVDAVSSSILRYTRPHIGSRIKVAATTLGTQSCVLGAVELATDSVTSFAD